MIHSCTDCGLVHDTATPQTNPEVEIARINAETQLAVAKLASRTENHVVETQAEADITIAEHEASALENAAAAGLQEEDIVEETNAPAVLNAPIVDSGDQQDDEVIEAPLEVDDDGFDESAPKKSRGFRMW